MKTKVNYELCPICGERLEVDEEYMYSTYGSIFPRNKKHWSYYCEKCDYGNTYELFLVKAEENYEK